MNKTIENRDLFSFDNLMGLTNANPSLISEFNQVFIDKVIGGDLPSLVSAYKERDLDRIKWFVHKIRPSVDLYNISSIQQTVIDLERNADAGVWSDSFHEMIEQVTTTIQAVGEAVKAIELSNQ